MSTEESSRLNTELDLLSAMYPTQTIYDPRSQDLKFTDNAATLHLRVPDAYPESGFPDVISATTSSKADIRTLTKAAIQDLGLAEGEEALDAIIAAFQQVVADAEAAQTSHDVESERHDEGNDAPKTVVIWLHHLLNTNKRKLALSPPNESVGGITKPGYPGVLVYSGPGSSVTDHVNTLKAQNWQAFQVRFEENVLWEFAHGKGVKEVESMSEVVKGVECDSVGEGVGLTQREEFLKAVGIK